MRNLKVVFGVLALRQLEVWRLAACGCTGGQRCWLTRDAQPWLEGIGDGLDLRGGGMGQSG